MSDSVVYSATAPSLGHYDVAVLGGGSAGVCAAVEAARAGAKTVLIESAGMLGGMATTALVGPFMTNYDRDGNRPVVGGLYREIIERLAANKHAILPEDTDSPSIHTSFIGKYHRHVTPFDAFQLQIVLDDLCREAGVEVLLYTRLVDCLKEAGKITHVILAALEGLRSLSANVFVDATGTADLSVAAGVPCWKGDEQTGAPQPGTLMFEVDHACDEDYNRFASRPKNPVKVYRMPEEGKYKVNHLRVFDVDQSDSRSMSRAHAEARKQVMEAYRVLREETPGFENARIAAVGSVLGVRESRHVRGRYVLTAQDLAEGICFDDRIAAFGYGMDVHPRNAEMHGNWKIEVAETYYLPYRSLLPLGCLNLLTAGKIISCESQAAGAIRVMPCAMALGQAAGLAAAMAVKAGVNPDAVPVSHLQETLRAHGAILD